MKHLKTYESTEDNGMYWLLPTDERLQQSLIDIKCPSAKIEIFLDIPLLHKNKYCFIIFYGMKSKRNDHLYWGWNSYNGKLFDPTSEKQGYDFQGTINLTEDEKMEFTANKYNL